MKNGIQPWPLDHDRKGQCGRYIVRVSVTTKGVTTKEDHVLRGRTFAEAAAFKREVEGQKATGIYVAKVDRKTVDQLKAAFLISQSALQKRTSTLRFYESVLDKHILPEWGKCQIGALSTADLLQWLEGMMRTQSSSVVNRTVRAFKSMMSFAVKRGMLTRNPLAGVAPFKDNKLGRRSSKDAYSEGEAVALVESAEGQTRAIVLFLLCTGARPAEAWALTVADIDLARGSAAITKSWDHLGGQVVQPKTAAGTRIVSLAPKLNAELREHIERSRLTADDLLFSTRDGTPLSHTNFRRRVWLPLIAAAGVRVLPVYSLRRTAITMARAGGEAAYNVARMVGHSRSLLVDAVYGQTLQSGMQSVATSIEARLFGSAKPTPAEADPGTGGAPLPAAPAGPIKRRRTGPKSGKRGGVETGWKRSHVVGSKTVTTH